MLVIQDARSSMRVSFHFGYRDMKTRCSMTSYLMKDMVSCLQGPQYTGHLSTWNLSLQSKSAFLGKIDIAVIIVPQESVGKVPVLKDATETHHPYAHLLDLLEVSQLTQARKDDGVVLRDVREQSQNMREFGTTILQKEKVLDLTMGLEKGYAPPVLAAIKIPMSKGAVYRQHSKYTVRAPCKKYCWPFRLRKKKHQLLDVFLGFSHFPRLSSYFYLETQWSCHICLHTWY